MDNLERARLTVLNRKHQFIMQLGHAGRTPVEAKKYVEMIDWDVEIEWAAWCYEACENQAAAEAAQREALEKRQASGS
jgi:hypothetical protein